MNKFEGIYRVIFDLDNTLIEHHFEEECIKVQKYFNIIESDEFNRQFKNLFSDNGNYFKNRIVTQESFINIIEKIMPILSKIGKTGQDVLDAMYTCHAGTLMEGAKDLLKYLYDKNYQIVAFTNWFYEHQMMILKKLDIAQYFERIYSWDDYYAKPNNYAVIKALDNTDSKNNVMIGDSLKTDIIPAKRNGIKSIGFNVNYSNMKKSVRADVDVAGLREIKQYL